METWTIALLWFSRLVLLLLFGLSVWSFSIMIDRWKKISPLENWDPQTVDQSPEKEMARKFYQELAQRVDNLQKTIGSEKAVGQVFTETSFELEKGLTVLATIGSNAPFIGLLGTVLGIIQVFAVLGTGASNSGEVMVGISEALVATAAGLFVAIPAVVAYNIFGRKLRRVMTHCKNTIDFSNKLPGGSDGRAS